MWHEGSYFPDQGLNPHPLQWKLECQRSPQLHILNGKPPQLFVLLLSLRWSSLPPTTPQCLCSFTRQLWCWCWEPSGFSEKQYSFTFRNFLVKVEQPKKRRPSRRQRERQSITPGVQARDQKWKPKHLEPCLGRWPSWLPNEIIYIPEAGLLHIFLRSLTSGEQLSKN